MPSGITGKPSIPRHSMPCCYYPETRRPSHDTRRCGPAGGPDIQYEPSQWKAVPSRPLFRKTQFLSTSPQSPTSIPFRRRSPPWHQRRLPYSDNLDRIADNTPRMGASTTRRRDLCQPTPTLQSSSQSKNPCSCLQRRGMIEPTRIVRRSDRKRQHNPDRMWQTRPRCRSPLLQSRRIRHPSHSKTPLPHPILLCPQLPTGSLSAIL
jgi:hypothetical protein